MVKVVKGIYYELGNERNIHITKLHKFRGTSLHSLSSSMVKVINRTYYELIKNIHIILPQQGCIMESREVYYRKEDQLTLSTPRGRMKI